MNDFHTKFFYLCFWAWQKFMKFSSCLKHLNSLTIISSIGCNVLRYLLCIYTCTIWAMYTKNYAAYFPNHMNIYAKFQTNWIISMTTIMSDWLIEILIKFLHVQFSTWLLYWQSFFNCYIMHKLNFDYNFSLFFYLPLYRYSFGFVHLFSNQTILLSIQVTYTNFVKFYSQQPY